MSRRSLPRWGAPAPSIHTTPARGVRLSAGAALLLAIGVSPLDAQTPAHERHAPTAAADGDARSRPAHGDPHLRLTPSRAATAADSARARSVERTLLAVLARYERVEDAEADGYVLFAPKLKTQPVFHFTNRRHALRNAFGFDAARPTSLLFRRTADGRMELVGAMFTASARTSLDALDSRIPLGLATWHQHVNLCLPRDPGQWSAREQGQPRFGPAGAIATPEACAAANGRWLPRAFGWMVHANLVRTTEGPAIAWEHAHPEHAHVEHAHVGHSSELHRH